MSSKRLPKLTTHRPSPTAHLRQRTFPPRIHLSFPSTKSSLRSSRRVAQQSTLTQMDFVTTGFEASDNEESSEFEAQQPRKRRKMGRTEREVEALRQATLTQIGWAGEVEVDFSEDEDGGDGGDDSSAANRVETDMMDEEIVKDEERPDGGADGPGGHKGLGLVQPTSPTRTHPSGPHRRSTHHLQPSDATSAHSTPPRRQMKREIPSSRSPSTTPLSTPADSPTKRTPLSEIPQNIWAQRDEEATPTPTPTSHKRRRKQQQIPDSDSEMEMEMEMEGSGESSEDKENLHRSIRNSSKNPSKFPFPRKETATPSTLRHPTTSTTPSPTTTTTTTTSTTPPPPPRPATPSLTPQTHDTPRSSQTHDTPRSRSSQATTVSLTECSPSWRVESCTLAGEGTVAEVEVEAFESQFPYSAYSACSVLEWEGEGEGEGGE